MNVFVFLSTDGSPVPITLSLGSHSLDSPLPPPPQQEEVLGGKVGGGAQASFPKQYLVIKPTVTLSNN